MAPTRGALIVLEGLDRTGKTTQCHRLAINLEKAGHQVHRVRFPDRTTGIGKTIDAYLANSLSLPAHAVHLLFSANRWEVVPQIRALLEAGTTVVLDRYAYSGAAYSAAKGVKGLDLAWAWAADIGLPRPDLVVFLELSEDEAAKRGGWGGERYETTETQRNVRAQFDQLWTRQGVGRVVRVGAGGDLEAVEARIWKAVLTVWNGPLSEIECLEKW